MSNSNVYLASKPRYEILDGLRGVAAMLVVAYHLFETYYGGGRKKEAGWTVGMDVPG